MGLVRYLVFIFLIIILLAAYVVQSTVQHEYIHQLIFKKYGIDSNVTYNFLNAAKQQTEEALTLNILNGSDIEDIEPWAWTTPDSNTTNECNETCEMLHTQQEMIDSQTGEIVLMIFVLFILYVMYHEFFSNREEDLKRLFDEKIESVKQAEYQELSRFDIKP